MESAPLVTGDPYGATKAVRDAEASGGQGEISLAGGSRLSASRRGLQGVARAPAAGTITDMTQPNPNPILILSPRRHRQAQTPPILGIPLATDWFCTVCWRQIDDDRPIISLGSWTLCSDPCGEELWLQPIRCCPCAGCQDMLEPPPHLRCLYQVEQQLNLSDAAPRQRRSSPGAETTRMLAVMRLALATMATRAVAAHRRRQR